jgi:hypothetical protein
MRCISRNRRWVIIIIIGIISILSQIGCGTLCLEKYALPIPGARSRSADLKLPLNDRDRTLAMLYLANIQLPDLGDPAYEEEIAEQYENLDAKIVLKFQKIMGVLSEETPEGDDLDDKGRIGVLFSPKGADEVALDSRFQGQIMSGYIRVGKLHGNYFVFYNRYPRPNDIEANCGEGLYCQLVIVNEVSIRGY